MAEAPPRQPKPPSIPRVVDEGWIVGKLVAHGQAPYHHEPGQSVSYFIRLQVLESDVGARQIREAADERERSMDGRAARRPSKYGQAGTRELWSWDLKRALRESKSHADLGMVVAAKIVSRDIVQCYV